MKRNTEEGGMDAHAFHSRLVGRYADGSATEEELELFFHLLATGALDAHLTVSMNEAAGLTDAEQPAIPASIHRLRPRWPRIAAAAVLILLAGSLYWFLRPHTAASGLATQEQHYHNDVAPGGNKAILTLAGGQTIILDSAHTGALAQQGTTRIIKRDSGSLSYQSTQQAAADPVQYNILTTPRGGQYQLDLPDGSKVWLDAASSIRYPTAFAGTDRSVTITGQAYFEVARDPLRPFTVKHDRTAIQVLGTSFNVNAYDDEPMMKVTLLEGKVKVAAGSQAQILLPGQQAQVTNEKTVQVLRAPDLDAVMAWKNGLFLFKGADLPTIMRQVSRWYNVEIVFEQPIHEKFFVEISRNTNASNLFRMLAITKAVHFKIEEGKVTVIP